MKKVILTVATLITLLASCKKKEETVSPTNSAPVITLAADDRSRTAANVGSKVSFYATATDADGSILKVVFYANNVAYDTVMVSSGSNKYYNDSYYKSTVAGDVKFSAVAYDNAGANTKSNEITVTYNAVVEEVKVTEVQVVEVKGK